jgi:DNA adenine methylase
MRPLLRWAGSKRKLLPVLSPYWKSDFARYVEPFAGSACLFFHLCPRSALLGDINHELMATYQTVKTRPRSVALALHALRRGPEEYYRLRGMDPSTLTPVVRAARFIFLNRFCFNGLYRTNRRGQFNVPYGSTGTSEVPDEARLREVSKGLRHARLVAGDFSQALEMCRPGDFVYMDPPFAVARRRVFSEYDASEFGSDDIVRLRQWMLRLASHGIAFVVSYAESEEADFLGRGFRTRPVTVRRNIAGFATSRCLSREYLILNVPRMQVSEDRHAVTEG